MFSPDLGALARYHALVGLVARALESECQRCHWHPHRLPTEGAMFDSLFWGPILAVLQFPVFGWPRKQVFQILLPDQGGQIYVLSPFVPKRICPHLNPLPKVLIQVLRRALTQLTRNATDRCTRSRSTSVDPMNAPMQLVEWIHH